jgi:hypothetical protein
MASRISIELYKQAIQLTKPLFIPLEYRKHKRYRESIDLFIKCIDNEISNNGYNVDIVLDCIQQLENLMKRMNYTPNEYYKIYIKAYHFFIRCDETHIALSINDKIIDLLESYSTDNSVSSVSSVSPISPVSSDRSVSPDSYNNSVTTSSHDEGSSFSSDTYDTEKMTISIDIYTILCNSYLLKAERHNSNQCIELNQCIDFYNKAEYYRRKYSDNMNDIYMKMVVIYIRQNMIYEALHKMDCIIKYTMHNRGIHTNEYTLIYILCKLIISDLKMNTAIIDIRKQLNTLEQIYGFVSEDVYSFLINIMSSISNRDIEHFYIESHHFLNKRNFFRDKNIIHKLIQLLHENVTCI